MCSVSAVIDTWRDNWGDRFAPVILPYKFEPYDPEEQKKVIEKLLTEQERAVLKKEIEEFRAILKRARAWDKAHPQEEPCDETPQKIEALRELVKQLGLEDEVEVVLKEVEDPDSDYYFEPPVTQRDNLTTVPSIPTSANPIRGGFIPGGGGGISVGGVGGYADSTSYT